MISDATGTPALPIFLSRQFACFEVGSHFGPRLRAGRLTVIKIGINLHYRMIPEISGHACEIARLCEKHRVLRLMVFGSAARDDFNEKSSDIDLIAAFASTREPGYADRYMDFADSLEALFGRKVDLLTPPSIRNPHFIESINRDAVVIYEAKEPQAA